MLDVCSGSVHVVDDLVYDMIAMYKDKKFEEIEQAILEKYGDTYSKEDIKDAYSDISELEEKELLFTEDVFKDVIVTLPASIVSQMRENIMVRNGNL